MIRVVDWDAFSYTPTTHLFCFQLLMSLDSLVLVFVFSPHALLLFSSQFYLDFFALERGGRCKDIAFAGPSRRYVIAIPSIGVCTTLSLYQKSLLKKLIFLYTQISVRSWCVVGCWIDVLWDHNDDDFHSVFNTLGVVFFTFYYIYTNEQVVFWCVSLGGGKMKIHTKRAWMCSLCYYIYGYYGVFSHFTGLSFCFRCAQTDFFSLLQSQVRKMPIVFHIFSLYTCVLIKLVNFWWRRAIIVSFFHPAIGSKIFFIALALDTEKKWLKKVFTIFPLRWTRVMCLSFLSASDATNIYLFLSNVKRQTRAREIRLLSFSGAMLMCFAVVEPRGRHENPSDVGWARG